MVEVRPVFDERQVHALVLAEMPDVLAGMRTMVARIEVQLAAAVVKQIGVVVGDAFAAQIVEGALNDAGIVGTPLW